MLIRLSFLFVALLLTGCSLHRPSKVALTVEIPPAYLENQAAEPGLSVDRWWLVFDDGDLNLLMAELFAQNLELSQAIARLQQVEAAFKITRSARSPVLTGGGNLGRSQQPGLMGDLTANNQQLSVAAGYELDLWGKLAAQSRASALELSASRQDIETLYLGLSARLTDLYFFAVEQRAQLALTDRSIRSFSDTLERVEDRYRSGLAPAIDMYQARQSLARAEAARYLFESNLADAEHAMAVLVGRYPERQSAGLAQLPPAPDLFVTGGPVALLSQRPDLAGALERVEAADARVAAAIADRFPTISLSGSSGSLRQGVAAGLLKGEFWNLLGNLALPIVDGGRRRAEVERQEAALREAVAFYQQRVLSAFQEVEDALASNFATEQRVARLAETTHATSATLRLATDRYLAGLADYLQVLIAQRNAFEASSLLLAARRQLLADRISLARSLGGTWMRDKVNLRLQLEEDKN